MTTNYYVVQCISMLDSTGLQFETKMQLLFQQLGFPLLSKSVFKVYKAGHSELCGETWWLVTGSLLKCAEQTEADRVWRKGTSYLQNYNMLVIVKGTWPTRLKLFPVLC